MNESEIQRYILESIPYPIVYVNTDHVICYLNKRAKYHYYQERGYNDLIGKSLLDCHNDEKSKNMIIEAVKKLQNHAQEIYLKINVRNERVYIVPVRNEEGKLLGYYERFEMNIMR